MKLGDRQTIHDKSIHGVPHTSVLALSVTCPSKHTEVDWLLHFERRFIYAFSHATVFQTYMINIRSITKRATHALETIYQND